MASGHSLGFPSCSDDFARALRQAPAVMPGEKGGQVVFCRVLMHFAHKYIRLARPFSITVARWILGMNFRLVRRLE